jgi:hypothetical protein
MAIILFTVLNGLGVVFLVYVLVQFWKEGQPPMKPAITDKTFEFPVKDRPTVLVVTHPYFWRTPSRVRTRFPQRARGPVCRFQARTGEQHPHRQLH